MQMCHYNPNLTAPETPRKVRILADRLSEPGILPENLPGKFRHGEFDIVARTDYTFIAGDNRPSLLLLMPGKFGHNYKDNYSWGTFGADDKYGWWVYESDCFW